MASKAQILAYYELVLADLKVSLIALLDKDVALLKKVMNICSMFEK